MEFATDQERRSYIYSAGKSVGKKADFPKALHLAIIEFSSFTTQEDYGNHDGRKETMTHSTMRYTWFKLEDRWVWEEKILELMTPSYGASKDFIALDKGQMVEPKLQVKIIL